MQHLLGAILVSVVASSAVTAGFMTIRHERMVLVGQAELEKSRRVEAVQRLQEEKNRHQETEYTNRKREIELRNLLITRAEIDRVNRIMKQQALAGKPLPSAPLGSEAATFRGNLDSLVDGTLREFPEEKAAEIRRLAGLDVRRTAARARAQELDAALRPTLKRVRDLIPEAGLVARGLDLVKDSQEIRAGEIPTIVHYWPDRGYPGGRRPTQLGSVRFQSDLIWTVFFHDGYLDIDAPVRPQTGAAPAIVVNDSLGQNVFYLSFENILSPSPATLTLTQPDGQVGGYALSPDAQEKLRKLQEDYRQKRITLDDFIRYAVIEGIKQSAFRFTTNPPPPHGILP